LAQAAVPRGRAARRSRPCLLKPHSSIRQDVPPVDEDSLQRLEFHRVTASVAACARHPASARALERARPLPAGEPRRHEIRLLAEALRREREPGEWREVGRGELTGGLAGGAGESVTIENPLDGPGLIAVLS